MQAVTKIIHSQLYISSRIHRALHFRSSMSFRSQRTERIRIAEETITILEKGHYEVGSTKVDITDAQTCATAKSKAWLPDELSELVEQSREAAGTFTTKFETKNETVLEASKRLLDMNLGAVCVLNFANAFGAGGGFLHGDQAQEESIARSSGLYPCIAQMEAHYQAHHAPEFIAGLYSDRMIYSPDVPVIRNDSGQLLQKWYPISVITAAAAHIGSLTQYNPAQIAQVPAAMRRRVEKVLALAHHYKYENLVLGAWGCGAFQQNPKFVSEYFAECLLEDGIFAGKFKQVSFAVLDSTDDGYYISPFQNRFHW